MFRIFAKRAKERTALRKRGVAIALNIGSFYLFPCLLPSITFATYIGLGNDLDFGIAVGALVLFQLMRGPIINIPRLLGDITDLFASMRKI